MGLTVIPTEVDGSLGRNKVNRINPPNLDEYASAAEWNTVKKAVGEIAAALGLADGSTAGSIEQKIRAVNDPLVGTGAPFRLYDEFEKALDTFAWTFSGTGSQSSGEQRNEVGAGVGLLKLVTTGASHTAQALWTKDTVLNAKHLTTVFRARVLFDSVTNLSAFAFGFSNGAGTTFAEFQKATTTGWKATAKSVTGGVTTTNDNLGSALVAATWYNIRIESSTAEHRFYINDALLATITASGSRFVSGDTWSWRLFAQATGAGGLNTYVDYADVRGVRA